MMLPLLTNISNVINPSTSLPYDYVVRLFGALVVTVVLIVYFFAKRARINNSSSNTNNLIEITNTSLLLTIYTNGVGLTEVIKGLINNYQYTLLMTSPLDLSTTTNKSDNDISDPVSVESGIDDAINFDSNGYGQLGGETLPIAPISVGTVRTPIGQLLLKVNLPVKTQVHIAGFSLKDTVFNQLLGNSGIDNMLNQVKLEGNFPDYFKLYSSPNDEIDVRQVLDPTLMEFLIDFCERINWEIIEDTIYFVSSGTTTNPDSKESLIVAAEQFVSKVLPTLQEMTTPVHPNPTNSNTSTLA